MNETNKMAMRLNPFFASAIDERRARSQEEQPLRYSVRSSVAKQINQATIQLALKATPWTIFHSAIERRLMLRYLSEAGLLLRGTRSLVDGSNGTYSNDLKSWCYP